MFLSLTSKKDRSFLINADHILRLFVLNEPTDCDHDMVHIEMTNQDLFVVKESLAEIRNMLRDCGELK